MPKTSATLLIIDDDEVVRASLAAYLEWFQRLAGQ
jgi:DNA-binding NarL/FixJ family response regulator